MQQYLNTHTHTCVCVCVRDIQIYKLCNFMVLRRRMCKNIILHTSMPEAWKCTVYILSGLPATPTASSQQQREGVRKGRDGAWCLHFNIIYMNLGCRKCWPHRPNPPWEEGYQGWNLAPATDLARELSLSELWICRCLSRECEHVLSPQWVCECTYVCVCVQSWWFRPVQILFISRKRKPKAT